MKQEKQSSDKTKTAAAEFDKLAQQAEQEKKTKKPGSQGTGNSSRHNNGRGGGK